MSINELPVWALKVKPASDRKLKANELIIEWYGTLDSNLLVLMGGVGSGKTTILKETLKYLDEKHTHHDFSDLIERNEQIEGLFEALEVKDDLIVIDNFDAVNRLSGIQVNHPDLRAINTLVKNKSTRVIVLTRRYPRTMKDEFWQQLTSPQRFSQFHFKNPFILHIQSWEISEIQEHGNVFQDESLIRITTFLS
jgi:chromosomal replication initiation ATPase DnaA